MHWIWFLIGLLLLLFVILVLFYIAKIAVRELGGPAWVLQIVGLILLLLFVAILFGELSGGAPGGWRLGRLCP